MPPADSSPPAARPPHPATAQRKVASQRKIGEGQPPHPAAQPKDAEGAGDKTAQAKGGRSSAKPPHPATVQRKSAEIANKTTSAKAPHPATVQRKSAEIANKTTSAKAPHPATVQRKATTMANKTTSAKAPHPATVKRSAAVQPKPAGQGRPPHPATLPARGAQSIQPSKKEKYYKKGSKGGVEVTLNGKKTFQTGNKSVLSSHAERLAVAASSGGDIALEQNAWPCSDCHDWLTTQSKSLGVTITVTITDDHGAYSMDHKKSGVKQGDTGTIVYSGGAFKITTD